MVRSGNEDSFIISPELGLFAIADGMGGHNAGEIASKMAIETLRDVIAQTAEDEISPEVIENPISAAAQRLEKGIRLANRAIHEASRNNPAWQNMGTTIVAALLTSERLCIAHVGDSRAYLLRAETIVPLTEDHSIVAEQLKMGLISREMAETSSQRNIITRALGLMTEPEADFSDLHLVPGDRVLLCSDGLTNMVSEDDILSIVHESRNAEAACRRLVDAANRNGGKDNITAVIVTLNEGAFSGLSHFFDRVRNK
jgi:protein phosphatase